jgi:cell wall-associated NlpC family hydrolase
MKNRHLKTPMACLVVLSFALQPGHSQTASAPPPSAPASEATAPGVTIVSGTTTPAHTMRYTVVAGDSLTHLADKFGTTRKKLEALNNLTVAKLTPGQVLLVPARGRQTASGKSSDGKTHHVYRTAQPVQDFDIPASTFASCPVPPPPQDDDSYAEEPAPGSGHAPIAQLVSPAEMSADATAQQQRAAQDERLTATMPPPRLTLPPESRPAPLAKLNPAPKLTFTPPPAPAKPAPSGWANNSLHAASSGQRFSSSLPVPRLTTQEGSMNWPASNPANAWGFKFLQQARALGDRGIDYDDDWRPPGERSSWTMDCSNTTRYLYQVTTGIRLPRTASDQYYYLHLQGKAWDVPTIAQGLPDVTFLQRNLRPGDLLFWENTYRPERQPPITHVMVFLGTNDRGQWIMAGSQSSHGGEHNRRNGGPDVYVFRPSQVCGGYTSWFVHHQGRFCAFGRPLEADPSKFALND